MGNHTCGEAVGHTITKCGCMHQVGFGNAAEVVINTDSIEPWPARSLIKERLEHQTQLAKKTPFRTISVADGLNHFSSAVKKWGGLSRNNYLKIAKNLCESKNVHCSHMEDDILLECFDSIDYDENHYLSMPEWAGGLTIFFKGTREEKTESLFKLLDTDQNGNLSKAELQEYLTPLVKAMTPEQAAALRPLLLQHAVDQIFEDIDLNHDEKISCEEMTQWRANNNVIDRLVEVIEAEVYKVWLEHNLRKPKEPTSYSSEHHPH